jgi:hypothetical protein
MKKCRYCGRFNDDRAARCDDCGTPLENPEVLDSSARPRRPANTDGGVCPAENTGSGPPCGASAPQRRSRRAVVRRSLIGAFIVGAGLTVAIYLGSAMYTGKYLDALLLSAWLLLLRPPIYLAWRCGIDLDLHGNFSANDMVHLPVLAMVTGLAFLPIGLLVAAMRLRRWRVTGRSDINPQE